MIFKFIKNYSILEKIKNFNRSEFASSKNKNKSSKLILLEFNSFQVLHVVFAYIVNYFLKKKKFTVKAYYSHILITYDLNRSFIESFKSKIANYLNLGVFGVYKSFGVNEIIFPRITSDIEIKSEKFYSKIITKIKNKNDVLEVKINNILVGDLIYDSYLTRNKKQKPTIDINDKGFKKFLFDFIKLYFFWEHYINNNNVKILLVSHSCYTLGLPCRIGLKKKVKCLEVKENRLKKLDLNKIHHYSETKSYPIQFENLKKKDKWNALKLSKNNLDKRFSGINLDMPYASKTAFLNNNYKKKINKKFTILILPHDFIDAPHIAGKFAFADMYEWIKFLSHLSLKQNKYNWLIKTHKKYGGKFSWYQNFTEKNIDRLIKNSNIKKLNSNTSHNEIISMGVDLVLTVFGTAAHEYAYKNIQVLNASKYNPHCGYDFNIHISNTENYKKFFNNLKKSKISMPKKKVLEFYYMHYIYHTKNWFFDDYNKMLKELGNYHDQWNNKFYKYWIDNHDKSNFKKKLEKKLDNFINSREQVFSVKNMIDN
jgi:hypothetical protein